MALIIAFSVVVVLIIDLDRPFRSLFKIDDQMLRRTLQGMER